MEGILKRARAYEARIKENAKKQAVELGVKASVARDQNDKKALKEIKTSLNELRKGFDNAFQVEVTDIFWGTYLKS